MARYEPSQIEPKWQAYWQANETFRTRDEPSKPASYILDMFPYPSGAGLHVGHPEGYTATDIVARTLRARGHAVLHPMGWDAFGLPAEQHALRTGTHPRDTTATNIATFKRQLQSLGFSYDWQREINTTDADYVRWTQWIFLKLFGRGLAYQAEIPVNWCAALGTVLANEEVKDGLSEIGGHPVQRLPLRQWMLRITAYADRLLDDLQLTDWPASTCAMQREWIGRSEGADVRFALQGHDATLAVYTTRPDTLYGVTFLAVAPEHAELLAWTASAQRQEVQRYVERTARKSEQERRATRGCSGVFTGAYAHHPLSGATVPIWTADYVLSGYGTGAVMGVPAHDERDFTFAQQHGLPIVEVVSADGQPSTGSLAAAFVADGVALHSGPYDGLGTAACKDRIVADLEQRGLGQRRVQTKLRDWVFSRQRYWGEPIPILFPVQCDGDPRRGDAYTIDYAKPLPVPEDELPLLLPELDDFRPGDDPAGPLARAVDWRFVQRDGRWYARETNTMPQWAGSCWYYLRYLDPHNSREPWSPEAVRRWLPVKLYVGGAEHAVLHLLYARFWHKVLYDEGLVHTAEPFAKLVHQGMILGEVEADGHAYKMSKSRGNVVNPDAIVGEFGADAMRVYEMFMGPLEAAKPWSTQSIAGVRRFLDRAFEVVRRASTAPSTTAPLDIDLQRELHRTVRKVSEDIDTLRFNTAISALMVLTNTLTKLDPVPRQAAETLALLLHPFAPHLGEELWQLLGHPPSVQHAAWPAFDPALCEADEVEVPVQIGGKVRARILLPKGTDEATAVARAQSLATLAPYLSGKTLRKVIWVQDKMLNVIVG